MPVPELVDLANALRKSESDLDNQVQEAVHALQKSSALVADLEEKLTERAGKLEDLQAEYKRVSSLASISETQARALAVQLSVAIGKSRRWDVPVAIVINLFVGLTIFLVGVIFSDKIKAFISYH